MIRRPPRSTRVRSSAASDVYKRQHLEIQTHLLELLDPLDLFLELIQVVIPQVISGSLVVAVVVLMVELTEVVVVELLLVIVLLVVVMVVTIQTVWELMEPNLPVVEVVPLIMGSWILATVGVTVVLVSFSSHILLDK